MHGDTILYTITVSSLLSTVIGQDPLVDTIYGSVSGKAIPLDDGSVIDSFLGVPFAKPPVGGLRFMLPEEPDPWDETFIADIPGNACVQDPSGVRISHPGWTRFSEDCLHLNIYSPQRENPDELYPVLVYIYGGDYVYGANFMYPGYILARKSVVVVTINYRLGILGFGYTGDGVVPGNMGLMDQILGLQFVQNNIVAFGGDPGQVTIFGESAGASSVGQLMFSPYSQGLFHGALMQSGCEMAIWPTHFPEFGPENFIVDVAQQFGCPISSSEVMVQCLRGVDADSLVNAGFTCPPGYRCWGFRPVIDGDIIPDTYKNLRERGEYMQVPEVIGNNENDGFYTLIYWPGIVQDGLTRLQFNTYLLGRANNSAQVWPDPSRRDDVYEAFKWYYADWPYYDDPFVNRDMLGKLITDEWYGFPADLQAKLHSDDGNTVYYFIYDYVPEFTDGLPDFLGAYHGLENKFVFGWPFLTMPENELAYNHSQASPNRTFTDYDYEYSDFMMTMWTNFARFGNPTPEPISGPNGTEVLWPEFTSTDLNFLNMKPEPVVKQDYRQDLYAFWREYLKYLIYGEEFEAKMKLNGFNDFPKWNPGEN